MSESVSCFPVSVSAYINNNFIQSKIRSRPRMQSWGTPQVVTNALIKYSVKVYSKKISTGSTSIIKAWFVCLFSVQYTVFFGVDGCALSEIAHAVHMVYLASEKPHCANISHFILRLFPVKSENLRARENSLTWFHQLD